MPKTTLLSILLYILTPSISHAQEGYQPLVAIEGFTSESISSADFGKYLNGLFYFGLAIAAILAVVMIIYGGVLYMGSESVFSKGQGREKIVGAILGLILALMTILIFNQINPDIVASTARLGITPANVEKQKGVEGNNSGGGGVSSGGNNNPTNPSAAQNTENGLFLQSPTTDIEKSAWDNPKAQQQDVSAWTNLLNDSGVSLKSSASINGVRQDSLNGAMNLQNVANSGPIVITSGTDASGQHANGTYSHGNGYKLDIRGRDGTDPNTQFDSWLNTEITNQTGQVPQNNKNYQITVNNQPMIVRPEVDHWDIAFGRRNIVGDQ